MALLAFLRFLLVTQILTTLKPTLATLTDPTISTSLLVLDRGIRSTFGRDGIININGNFPPKVLLCHNIHRRSRSHDPTNRDRGVNGLIQWIRRVSDLTGFGFLQNGGK